MNTRRFVPALVGLVIVVVFLAGCAEEEGWLPPITRVPLPAETPVETPALSSTPTPESTGVTPTPDTPTVWRPREVVAEVQLALAQSLGARQEDVPWVALQREVDPAKFTCLDQLTADVPTFAENEALVFLYKEERIYVVSSQGALWVCRLTEEQAESEPMTLDVARDLAVADLVRRLGVDPAAVQVISAKEVTWPDRSAGCPQAGVGYAQVPTPGYEIVLAVENVRYIYRGTKEDINLCATEEAGP